VRTRYCLAHESHVGPSGSAVNGTTHTWLKASPLRGRDSFPNPKIDATCHSRAGGPKLWAPRFSQVPKAHISHCVKCRTYSKLMARIVLAPGENCVGSCAAEVGEQNWLR
jgi:hypothetical protein